MKLLDNKVAVITGSAAGIGKKPQPFSILMTAQRSLSYIDEKLATKRSEKSREKVEKESLSRPIVERCGRCLSLKHIFLTFLLGIKIPIGIFAHAQPRGY
jgi:hypothetical protein